MDNTLHAGVVIALVGILLFGVIGTYILPSVDAGKGIRVVGTMKSDGRILLLVQNASIHSLSALRIDSFSGNINMVFPDQGWSIANGLDSGNILVTTMTDAVKPKDSMRFYITLHSEEQKLRFKWSGYDSHGSQVADGAFTTKNRLAKPQITEPLEQTTPFPSETVPSSPDSSPADLATFQKWANKHGIILEGISIDSNTAYYNGYNSATDKVELNDVPGVSIAADALYKIPDSVLQTMEGKTFYFSTKPGRSYTVLSSFPEQNILTGLNRGIILEQSISEHTMIHEFGHIVDYHGIQGIYEDAQNIFGSAKEERDKIFKVTVEYEPASTSPPEGYMSVYSTANDAENFAEHFAYYVLHADEFREKMKNDSLLAAKYNFLKNLIFDGKEY